MSNSNKGPWIKDKWLPGVLNKEQMQALIDNKYIINALGGNEIDNADSAIDLHLTDEGYCMIRGSVKPFHNIPYGQLVKDTHYAEKQIPDSNGVFTLKRNMSYVFKLNEALNASLLYDTPICGQATAKSSIGRVDVIARLIVDGMNEYETFDTSKLNEKECGDMYIEITPITFNVKVKKGIPLSQLRFFYGDIDDSSMSNMDFINSVLNSNGQNTPILSVDLTDSDENIVAFLAKDNIDEAIQLWGSKVYDPDKFWEPIAAIEHKGLKSIKIEKNRFYILRSKERISLPNGVSIYCRAMDETIGEMRIHYAGFVHPRFGLVRQDDRHGTPLIFEVRGHNVDVLLTDNEILARLHFYRMSREVIDPNVSSSVVPDRINSYYNQELKLSNFFKDWV